MEDTSEYQPLSVGKFMTYRLDSTVFVNFGRDEEIRSFEEKHIVDAEFYLNAVSPSGVFLKKISSLRTLDGNENCI